MITQIYSIARNDMLRYVRDLRCGLFFLAIILATIFMSLDCARRYHTMANFMNDLANGSYKEQEHNAKKGLDNSATMAFDSWLSPRPSAMLAGSRKLEMPRYHRFIAGWGWINGPENVNEAFPMRSFFAVNLDYSKFMDYDLAFLIETLLSFMIIILGFGSVSQDRKEGSLRLLLSFPTSRMAVFYGKALALAFITGFALILTAALFLFIVSIRMSTGWILEVSAILPVFLFVSACYLLFWIFLTLIFSSFAKTSQQALTLLLSCWLVFIFIIPASARMFLGKDLLPTDAEMTIQYQNMVSQMVLEAKNAGGYWRGGNFELSALDNHGPEIKLAPFTIPNVIKTDDFEEQLVLNALKQLDRANKLALISPAVQYRYICESLCGTNSKSYYGFLKAIKQYRNELLDFIVKEDAKDPDSFHILFLPGYMSKKPVPYERYPVFKMVQEPWQSRIPYQNILVSLSFLVIMGFLAALTFVRQEV
jgi:ABC-type transport system involved in multi-copper enzyme maturation permease subunit